MQELAKWIEDGASMSQYVSYASWTIRHNARKALKSALEIKDTPNIGDTITAWRGTDRAEEHTDVDNGLKIISKNYADGTIEKGMSVAPPLATVAAYTYKYAYQVTGTVIDFGSDGEPVLIGVKTAGKRHKASKVLDHDLTHGATAHGRKILKKLSTKYGVSTDKLLQLAYSNC